MDKIDERKALAIIQIDESVTLSQLRSNSGMTTVGNSCKGLDEDGTAAPSLDLENNTTGIGEVAWSHSTVASDMSMNDHMTEPLLKNRDVITLETIEEVSDASKSFPDATVQRQKQFTLAFMLRIALSLVVIAVLPSLVTCTVRAMGFTQNGIRARSLASIMMSAAARNSGNGGVKSGGVVATLQNIGVKGLGIVGSFLVVLLGTGVILSFALMRKYQACTCKRRNSGMVH